MLRSASVFCDPVGNSRGKRGQEASAQKRNVFPNEQLNQNLLNQDLNQDLLTERGIGLDKGFQTSNFQIFTTKLGKAGVDIISSNS